jgi:ATP/maltotriose-dependent transcriptional regulator MalT
MTQSTPYTPGVVARALSGREQQLGVCDERALLISELQQFVGRIRVEVAPRGMGKTSLLRQAQKKMENNSIATSWVTAGE